MTDTRQLLHLIFLFLLPIVVAWFGISTGGAIALVLLAHGCHVHICDIDADAISEFLKRNPGASATRADISNVAHLLAV